MYSSEGTIGTLYVKYIVYKGHPKWVFTSSKDNASNVVSLTEKSRKTNLE